MANTSAEFERHFDADEMRQFGYDPEVADDRRQWLITEPAEKDQPYDYNEDTFEYAVPQAGQQGSNPVE